MMTQSSPLAVVTGAAGGIGSAVCARLRADDWLVVGLDATPVDEVVACDVTDDTAVCETMSDIMARFGGIDALVNVAGAAQRTKFLEADDDLWNWILDVNLMGTVRCCRAAIPHLQASTFPTPSIVNFASQAAKTGGLAIGAPYSAAKAAVLCLTKSLATEFGSKGIRVNAVAPGLIDTPFLDHTPEVRDRGPGLPLGRIGAPDDVASVVSFLLSPAAGYLTGEIIDVNGGLLMD